MAQPAEDDYRSLPYLSEGEAAEGEATIRGYRLEGERGYIYLAPLSGDEIYVSSDCIDAEGLADKRGLTPRPYQFKMLLERDGESWSLREGSAAIGLMSGSDEGFSGPRREEEKAARLDDFGHWVLSEVSDWALAHSDKLAAAQEVNRHNRIVDLSQDIKVTESRLASLKAELLEVSGVAEQEARPELSTGASVLPVAGAAGLELER